MFNKTDLLPAEEVATRCEEIITALNWTGPVAKISAISSQGTDKLASQVMDFIERLDEERDELLQEDND